MILSIVVTVYNKEKYIKKCLDSCTNQKGVSSKSYEVIVVNDGSSDASEEIIKEYIKENGSVKLISQTNKGLSTARSVGLKNASGQYIWFVDADDSISENAVSLIISATISSPDIIPIYAMTEKEPGIRNQIPTTVESGRDILLSDKWSFCGPFYIYNKFFLIGNELFYYPGIYHEDADLTPRLLFYVKSVVVIDKVLYMVSRDPFSITQIPKIKRAYDYLFIANRLYSFSRSNAVNDYEIIKVFDNRISLILNNALYIIRSFGKEQQRAFDQKVYKEKHLLASLSNGGKYKYRVEYLLFSLFPGHYSSIYSFLKVFSRG